MELMKSGISRFRELDGESAVIRALRNEIARVAQFDARVMILGESGVGKETAAQSIHRLSPRSKGPFVPFCCSSVAPDLLASKFFGHRKGAYTGACENASGLFEDADGGTLFLDEIGCMGLDCQNMLMRAIEEECFSKLGTNEQLRVNVRLVTATNSDLAALVRAGKFRLDLYHRLNVIRVKIPPLRDHKSDIAGIAQRWWKQHMNRELSDAAIEELERWSYPGNVRELQNILTRAMVYGEDMIPVAIEEQKELHMAIEQGAQDAGVEYPDNLDIAMRCHVQRILAECAGNKTAAAKRLGCSRNTVVKYCVTE